ncbi:g2857 [Coccomyxa elongata]
MKVSCKTPWRLGCGDKEVGLDGNSWPSEVSALVESINAVQNVFWEVLWPDQYSRGWTTQSMGSGNIFILPPMQKHLLPTTTSVQDFLRYLHEHPLVLQYAPSPSGEAPSMLEASHNLARARNTLPNTAIGAHRPA